jgi:hypothetical protein
LTAVATVTVGVGRVEYVEAHADRILAANVAAAAVELISADGTQLFTRSFPGMTLASLRLSKTGDRVFLSLMRADRTHAAALWLDEHGTTLWGRSGDLMNGIYDANIASDGRSVALVAIAVSPVRTGSPAFEIVNDEGKRIAVSPVAEGPVNSVQSSADLSRNLVTISDWSHSTGDEPPDTIVERFEKAKRLDVTTAEQIQEASLLSPSGTLLISAANNGGLTLRSWDGIAAIWQQPGEAVSQLVFSTDETRLFVMRVGSSETGGAVTYPSGMDIRDCTDGRVLWNTTLDGSAQLRPTTSGDFSAIALVPFGGTEGAVLYRRAGDIYTSVPLASGTTAASFTDDGHLVLGCSSAVSLY